MTDYEKINEAIKTVENLILKVREYGVTENNGQVWFKVMDSYIYESIVKLDNRNSLIDPLSIDEMVAMQLAEYEEETQCSCSDKDIKIMNDFFGAKADREMIKYFSTFI